MNKRTKIDFEGLFEEVKHSKFDREKITGENLDLDYYKIFNTIQAREVFQELEKTIEYDELAKVKVFGKWHQIPRQQAAYGDENLNYRFSGTNVPAKSWIPILQLIRDLITHVTGFEFNFVLINRYRNGSDHIGEHKDNEADLDQNAPIASVSLGQQRKFVLKHQDARKSGIAKRNMATVKVELQNGSLLMMNPPTNKYWYHSLPPAKKALGVRANLTFRKIIP